MKHSLCWRRGGFGPRWSTWAETWPWAIRPPIDHTGYWAENPGRLPGTVDWPAVAAASPPPATRNVAWRFQVAGCLTSWTHGAASRWSTPGRSRWSPGMP